MWLVPFCTVDRVMPNVNFQGNSHGRSIESGTDNGHAKPLESSSRNGRISVTSQRGGTMVGTSHSVQLVTLDLHIIGKLREECDSAAVPSLFRRTCFEPRVRGPPAASGSLSALGAVPISAFQIRKVRYLTHALDLNQTHRHRACHADRKRRCTTYGWDRWHRPGRAPTLRVHLRRCHIDYDNPRGHGERSGGNGRKTISYSGVVEFVRLA